MQLISFAIKFHSMHPKPRLFEANLSKSMYSYICLRYLLDKLTLSMLMNIWILDHSWRGGRWNALLLAFSFCWGLECESPTLPWEVNNLRFNIIWGGLMVANVKLKFPTVGKLEFSSLVQAVRIFLETLWMMGRGRSFCQTIFFIKSSAMKTPTLVKYINVPLLTSKIPRCSECFMQCNSPRSTANKR